MSTNKGAVAAERIIAAALSVLREEGILGLTQPRVAKAAQVRQSHLTYYFPTRSDLVAAVAEAVAQRLLAAFDEALARTSRPDDFAAALTQVCAPEQTRLLIALVLAADREPAIRVLFRKLTKDIRQRIGGHLGIDMGGDAVGMLHALGVGLAVLDLARNEPASRRDLKTSMALALGSVKKPERKR